MQAQSFKVRVDAVRDEAHGVRSFAISRLDGVPFDAYEPGAHIDVTSPSGVTRQYSLCGDPDCREMLTVPLGAYRTARRRELFLVAPGHGAPSDRVVEHRGDYVVVAV